MSAHRVPLVVVLLAALGAAALRAQTSAAATPASILKTALRTTLTAQERFYAANETYAPSVEALGLRPEAGVRVDILVAGANGWQGRATHQSQPGRSCVVFVGSLEGAEAPSLAGGGALALVPASGEMEIGRTVSHGNSIAVGSFIGSGDGSVVSSVMYRNAYPAGLAAHAGSEPGSAGTCRA